MTATDAPARSFVGAAGAPVPAEPAASAQRPRRSRDPRRMVVALMVWLGVLVLLYPTAAQWMEQREQSRANAALAEVAANLDPADREQLLEEAHAYNRVLASGLPTSDYDYGRMLALHGTDVIARLRVPSIDLDQPIRRTLGESALTQGLGHSEDTTLPVGGLGTNSVIGGHRGLAESLGFTHLPDVEVGDLIYVEVMREVLTYQVTSTEVLEPLEAAFHPIDFDRDILTLITCTPLGVNSHRFVVEADRIETPENEEPGKYSELPRFPWWLVAAAATTLGAAWYAFAPARTSKRSRSALAAGKSGIRRRAVLEEHPRA